MKELKKDIKKTFVIDETTNKQISAIKRRIEKTFGSSISEGMVIRKAINFLYKNIKKLG